MTESEQKNPSSEPGEPSPTEDCVQREASAQTSSNEEVGKENDLPTEEEMKAVSPIGGLFPKWDRHNQSIGKILLYCLLFVVVLMVIGYLGNR